MSPSTKRVLMMIPQMERKFTKTSLLSKTHLRKARVGELMNYGNLERNSKEPQLP